MVISPVQEEQILRKRKLYKKNYFELLAWEQALFVCGLDEVGRGCLAGPLVVAAVILPQNVFYPLLKDSKLLTKEEREKAYKWIVKKCFYTVTLSSNYHIDQVNIYQSTVAMMKKAVMQLFESMPLKRSSIKYVVSDAVPFLIPQEYRHEHLEFVHFPKGERVSTTIAAASIVAKVTRDALMKSLNPLFHAYNFEQHKGYATQEHIEALKKHGPSILHRTSFLGNIQLKQEHDEAQQKP